MHLMADSIHFCIYTHAPWVGAMLRNKTSVDLSAVLFALVVGAGPQL